jgi:hypothetical protein
VTAVFTDSTALLWTFGTLAGFLLTAATFWHREGSDIIAARERLGSWKLAIREKGLDGWMDGTMPICGAGTGILTVTGGFAGFVAGVFGSTLYFGIVWAYCENTKRKHGR